MQINDENIRSPQPLVYVPELELLRAPGYQWVKILFSEWNRKSSGCRECFNPYTTAIFPRSLIWEVAEDIYVNRWGIFTSLKHESSLRLLWIQIPTRQQSFYKWFFILMRWASSQFLSNMCNFVMYLLRRFLVPFFKIDWRTCERQLDLDLQTSSCSKLPKGSVTLLDWLGDRSWSINWGW